MHIMHDLSRICIFAFYVGGVGIYILLLIISDNRGSDDETWVGDALYENV